MNQGANVETEDWAIEDPKDKPVEKLREIRDEIKERVTRLVDELRLKLQEISA